MRILLCILGFLLFSSNSFAQASQHWQSLGYKPNRLDVYLYADTEDNVMYIHGALQRVNGMDVNIAKWNGHSLSYIPKCPIYEVYDMAKYHGKLYACGNRGLACFDGSAWQYVDSLVAADRLQIYHDKLLVMGPFATVAGQNIANAALYDGSTWADFYRVDTLLAYPYWRIESVAEYKGELYIGGNFNPSGKPAISEIARFDGQRWTDVGGGLKAGGLAGVSQLLVWNNDLYISGGFLEANGAPGNNIVRWDGQAYHRLRDGIQSNGGVYTMSVHNNSLCVGGDFEWVDNIPAMQAAKWDGSKWCSFCDTPSVFFLSSCEYNGDLYFSGGFQHINGDSSLSYVVKWIGGVHSDSCSEPLVVPGFGITSTGASLYPNPASDKLYFSGALGCQVYDVIDMTGRMVQSGNLSVSEAISICSLPTGVYTLRAVTKQGEPVMLKFVKH